MRSQYTSAFKAQIVLEALKEIKTIAQIASEHQLHPNLVTNWKQEAVAELPVVFERKNTHRKPRIRKSRNFMNRSVASRCR